MQIRKIDLMLRSAEELKISGITSDLNPEEAVSFLGRLDELMANLAEDGLDAGYMFPENYGESDPDDDSGLSLWMVRPIAVLLADDISSSFGRAETISPLKISAAYDSLSNGLVEIEGSKYPRTMPIGTANEYLGVYSYFYKGNSPREE